MTRTQWMIGLGWCTLATCALLSGGCEDSQARTRDEVQKTITQAMAELRAAATSDPSDDAARGKLQTIANKLAAVKDGAPGQKSIAALLAADANEMLGRLDLSRAERMEAGNRADRLLIHNVIDAAGPLEAIAAGRQTVTEAERRALLDRQKQGATQGLQTASQAVAGLDTPIATIRRDNGADAQERAKFRQQSDALFAQAAEQSRTAGLPDYKHGTEVLRQVHQVERRMAGRDLELQYHYQPEMNQAQSLVDLHKSLLQQIDDARAALDGLDQDDAAQIKALRQRVAEFRTGVDKLRDEMNSRTSGDLAGAYDSAAGHFEQAATLAERAAGQADRSASGACRLGAVQAKQMLSETHAARARGLADQAALLERLQATGEALGNPQAIAAELQKTRADQQAAHDLAVQAITAAQEGIEQVSSRGNENQLALLKESLKSSHDALEGRKPAVPDTAAPAAHGGAAGRGDSAAGASEPAAESSTGFATPDELLAALQSVSASDPESMQRYAQTWRSVSATGRQTLNFMRSMMESVVALNQAMVERFGADALKSAEGGSGLGDMPIPDFTQAKITDRSEDKATIEAPLRAGGTMSLACIRVDSLWYINVDSLLPKGQRVTAQEVALMQMMGNVMKAVMPAIAQRVRAGEFQSVAEVIEAIKQESAKKTMEMMGAPGGPGAPGAAPPGRRSGGRPVPTEPSK